MLNTLCVTDINVVAKPIHDVDETSSSDIIRKKNNYKAFYFHGNTYELDDTVLLAADPLGRNVKPHVAIIKEINETENGRLMLTVQWFYRPEDVKTKHSKNSESSIGARELYYTFHKDKVVAESVMHKCTVHFVPEQKQIPCRKEHPGFIVQKLYNPNTKRLLKLNNKGYIDSMKLEIEQLVNKTVCRLGVLPDIKSNDDDSSDEEVISE